MNDITDTVRTSIGKYVVGRQSFEGNFDGNGFKIVLGIVNPSSHTGLFGCVGSKNINVTISNVTVEGYIIKNSGSGDGSVGGILGISASNYTLTIENCINNCDVTTTVPVSYVGGIIGFISAVGNRIIENCINSGKVSGDIAVGGISGMPYGNAIIRNCLNIGDIKGNSSVGGIASFQEISTLTSNITISNCANYGLVVGNDRVGGIMGYFKAGTVSNCFNSGVVIGNANVGGIIGYRNNGTVSNCHYDKQMCGYGGINNTDVARQAVGYLTNEMTGTQLQSKLGTNFTYATNLYPMLTALSSHPASSADEVTVIVAA